jgi:hypothetical protein
MTELILVFLTVLDIFLQTHSNVSSSDLRNYNYFETTRNIKMMAHKWDINYSNAIVAFMNLRKCVRMYQGDQFLSEPFLDSFKNQRGDQRIYFHKVLFLR